MNRLAAILLAFAGISLFANKLEVEAAEANWRYRGEITDIFANSLNLPISVGMPASFEIQFDSLTHDSSSGPGGIYHISGSLAGINMKIGDFSSTPVDRFTIHVLPQGCCAADDQVNFLAFNPNDVFIHVDFPNFLNDAEFILFFRQKKDPITSDVLPLAPPNPKDFLDVRFGLRKGPIQQRTLSFNGKLVLHVPEPASILLAAGSLCLGMCCRCLRP